MIANWFHRGAAAWQRVSSRPDRGYLYVCPLCGRGFSLERIRALSIEHAPAKAFGGKALCLTCKECNHRAGSQLDIEALKYELGYDFQLGTMPKPVPASLTLDATTVFVDMHAIGDSILLMGIPEANSLKASQEMTELLRGVSADPDRWRKTDINIEFDAGHPRRAHLAVLRWAYLVSFALFGYRYVFNARLRPIRDQLASPDDEILPVFSVTDVEQSRQERRVFFIREPQWLQSIAVQIGRHVVYLPDPWAHSTPYEEMARQSRAGQKLEVRIEGSMSKWPASPMHLFDD